MCVWGGGGGAAIANGGGGTFPPKFATMRLTGMQVILSFFRGDTSRTYMSLN